MYVACPSCKTLYQIQAEHLHAAGGQVRCSSCLSTFSATEAIFDDPAQALAFGEQQHVERDIEALVSRALDQVPGSEPVDEHGQAGAGQQDLQPEAEDTQGTRDVEHEQSYHEPWSEPHDPLDDAASAVRPAEPDRDPPGSLPDPDHHSAADAVDAAADDMDVTLLPLEEIDFGEDEPDQRAAEGVTREAPAGTAEQPQTAPAGLRADIDFQAQPLAAEFVSGPEGQDEPGTSVASALLLDHDYHDGVSHAAWGAIAASLLLTLLLVAQYAFAERHRLASVPQLRPALEFACERLGCDLPMRRNVAQVEILEREVRDHPNVEDALLINVNFANQADFVQPYPVFAVSFSDVSGTPVAARRFAAHEYLPEIADPGAGMQPGQRAQLILEVIDPGDQAVSFQFDFL
jgi:predicted Zn finger-like uncharacterized protein